MNTNTAKIIADATDPNRHGWTTTITPFTEVHGGMYCVVHNDFALEGNSRYDECDSYADINTPWSSANDAADCDLRDLFIQGGTR
jgi:hypothetical protein